MKIAIAFICILSTTLLAYSQSPRSKFSGCEIKVDGKWIAQDTGIPPVNVDSLAFDQVVISQIQYPQQALRMGMEEEVSCWIQIDTSGEKVKYSIEKGDIVSELKIEVAKFLLNLPKKWTPATINNVNYDSRVKVLFKFYLDDGKLSWSNPGDNYKAYLIMAIGLGKIRTIEATNFQGKTKKKRK